MQVRRLSKWWVFALAAVLLAPSGAVGQTVNGAVVGVVQDSSGGVVPDVALTIRNIARDEVVGTTVSEADGSYAFRNLAPGKYEVQATKDGFSPVSFPDVEVTLGQQVRLDVALAAGGVSERVEVLGGTSVLGTTPTQEHGISPETLNQLPLLFGTGPRAAATFALLMPGVSTGAGNNAFDARINGGLQSGDEASVDGVSMQQGFMSQGGMVSILQDFPMSPDMVSEIKVLTSGYAPEYGSSTGGQIMAVTKSGSNQFHGSAFEFHQDASLTAIQWGRREGAVQQEQLRRQHRRSDRAARNDEREVEELLLLRSRAVPAGRRRDGSRCCRFRRCRNGRATSATGATPPAT